ncbi:MAG: T9SS type A sorting domain-containing protein [Bacteroidia bacterium]
MRKQLMILVLMLFPVLGMAQGFNHQWLLGNQWLSSVPKARMFFDTSSYTLQTEYRKMPFEGTEASICDANGNFLMSSNGVWIANANNDTMLNGSGLNPGGTTSLYPHCLLLTYANIFIPFPGDSSKYILFHHTDSTFSNSYATYQIFTTTVDLTLDGGLGGIISKNNIVLADTLNWGLAACKHANGRDWWIVCQKENSDIIIEMLLTPNGITNISYQSLGVPIARFNVTQPTFSQDGSKFAYNRYDPSTGDESVIIADFDRCTGLFSNAHNIPVTLGTSVWGLAFSASANYVYACSNNYIFQVNVTTLLVDTVATYDGFCYPNSPWCTTFWNMYLAANGKIYVTSGSGVQHIHEMNYPDSTGFACDMQQHAIFLGVWNLRAVPNYPNYYLGPVAGSVCDSLGLSVQEINYDFRFRVYPNPVSSATGGLNIGYLLPQNKSGQFRIYDITGKVVFNYVLPQWSNEQSFTLPELSDGVYNCVITSGTERVSKKVAVMRE